MMFGIVKAGGAVEYELCDPCASQLEDWLYDK